MISPSALIVFGGWVGHDPDGVSQLLDSLLRDDGFTTERTDDISALTDPERLTGVDLVVPVVTMADPPKQGFAALLSAVEAGTGIAGCHGGMCDAFRTNTEWQFLTGAQFVAHPGDILPYRVDIADRDHPITIGLEDFDVETEQYYLHVDLAIHTLATTEAPAAAGPHSENPSVAMPIAWVKRWGRGRVFCFAIGHSAADLLPAAPREMMRRGMLWAAGRL